MTYLIQNNIEIIDNSDDQINYRDSIVNLYFEFMPKAEDLLETNSTLRKNNPSVRDSVTSRRQYLDNIRLIKMKPLELPTFFGNFEEWSTIHDLFISMVHLNSNIIDVQKFVYSRM